MDRGVGRPERPRRVFRRRLRVVVLVVALAAPIAVATPRAALAAPADECRAGNPAGAAILATVAPIVHKYLGVHPQSSTGGVSLAVVGPTPGAPTVASIAIVNCGVTVLGGTDPTTSDTLYEMGSETKTFTAVALAQLLLAGGIDLDDPVQAHVPAPFVVPDHPCAGASATMTIRDLVTHNAGLQDLPENRTWKVDPEGRALYTRTDLWDSFATGWPMPCDALLFTPGTGYSYSDWGFGLLGTILADLYAPNPGGVPNYAQLVADLVTVPLGLTSTVLEPVPPVPQMATPTCAPHHPSPCYFNNDNAFAGAGGLVTTIRDMAAYVAANLGFAKHPAIWPALALTHQPAGIGESCATCEGLAWGITPPTVPGALSPFPILGKDGGTNGMHSQTYLAPDACWGVTVLSSANEPFVVGPDGIAGDVVRALGPTQPCPPAPVAAVPRFTG